MRNAMSAFSWGRGEYFPESAENVYIHELYNKHEFPGAEIYVVDPDGLWIGMYLDGPGGIPSRIYI